MARKSLDLQIQKGVKALFGMNKSKRRYRNPDKLISSGGRGRGSNMQALILIGAGVVAYKTVPAFANFTRNLFIGGGDSSQHQD